MLLPWWAWGIIVWFLLALIAASLLGREIRRNRETNEPPVEVSLDDLLAVQTPEDIGWPW